MSVHKDWIGQMLAAEEMEGRSIHKGSRGSFVFGGGGGVTVLCFDYFNSS